MKYDIAFVGAYTKDTIVSGSGTRVVDGGAFNYGAHAAACMGLKVVAVTRLARDDWRVVERLSRLGVDVLALPTGTSTCLRLVYPTANMDERIIEVTAEAGSFEVDQVAGVTARAFVVGSSFRGEVGPELIEALAAKGGILALDAQGFVRVHRNGRLEYDAWPENAATLGHVQILKADAVEARILTGEEDLARAAQRLAELGPSEILLTHQDGVLLFAGGQDCRAGFYASQLVGRSGRGDTCLAAYVGRRLTAAPPEAVQWAAALTSLKMEVEGPFMRSMDEVDALIRRRYSPCQ